MFNQPKLTDREALDNATSQHDKHTISDASHKPKIMGDEQVGELSALELFEQCDGL
jgi:hypothetical protein